jgi:Acetyltransferases, including N-acetylases of ribosomal proteins
MSTAALPPSPRPPAPFHTARLFARPPREDDAPAVFATYASDPEATRYLAWKPYTDLAPLAAFLRERARKWETGGDIHYPYLLHRRDTGELIGSIGIFIEPPKAMFGYVLGRPHWGNGYAAEALTFLVDWALAQPQLRRAWAYCAAENTASIRVMEKAGLQREGLLRRWQVFPNLGREPRDCVFYAKVK